MKRRRNCFAMTSASLSTGRTSAEVFGGAFKATKGLAKEFPGRVLNTPISEDAIVGTAIGAAMQGMRPIVEMQFADLSSVALNQILNNAGTHYWRQQTSRSPSRCVCPLEEQRAAPRPTANRWSRFTHITQGSS